MYNTVDEFKKNLTERKSKIFKRYFEIWKDKVRYITDCPDASDTKLSELFEYLLLNKKELTYDWKNELDEYYKTYSRISTTEIRNWINGKSCPTDSKIEEICRVFDIDVSKFYPEKDKTILGVERYSPELTDKKSESLRKYAVENGVSEGFIAFVTGLAGVDKIFPFHSCEEFISEGGVDTDSPFQITDSKKYTAFISEADIDFLKELSVDVAQLIEHRLREEKSRLQNEEYKNNLNLLVMNYCRAKYGDEYFEMWTATKERVFDKLCLNEESDFHREYFVSVPNKWNMAELIEETAEEIYRERHNIKNENAVPDGYVRMFGADGVSIRKDSHYSPEWELEKEKLKQKTRRK